MVNLHGLNAAAIGVATRLRPTASTDPAASATAPTATAAAPTAGAGAAIAVAVPTTINPGSTTPRTHPPVGVRLP